MDKIWYVKSDKRKGGPFTEAELIRLIEAEIVTEEYGIWTETLERWIPLVDSVYAFYIPEVEL